MTTTASMPLPTPTVNPDLAPIIIIDNYDSFTYNLYQMLQAQTSHPVKVFRNDAIDWEALKALKPNRVVLSPGPGHPGVDTDFGICKQIVTHAKELQCPILGVCLGHQGIAHHSGGSVIAAPEILHGKTSMVSIDDPSKLLEGLPNPFEVMRYHSLLVEEKSLPQDFTVTAREVNAKLPMAIQHKTLPIYGVQFHPESIGTPEGALLLKNFLEKC